MDWFGRNDGRCSPDPGTVHGVRCGICETQMTVKRNVLGPTSFAESLGGGKHLHDSFTCPNLKKSWHERVAQLIRRGRETPSERERVLLAEEIAGILSLR